MTILAIDPGTHESGYCLYDGGRVVTAGVMNNCDLLKIVADDRSDVLAIEKIVNQGNLIGQETIDSVEWIGRFQQAWGCPDDVLKIPRRDVKKALGIPGSSNDAQVNARLREILGDKGTKANPGATFGVTSHAWAALGVAYAAAKRT